MYRTDTRCRRAVLSVNTNQFVVTSGVIVFIPRGHYNGDEDENYQIRTIDGTVTRTHSVYCEQNFVVSQSSPSRQPLKVSEGR
jgi:hypothetical protein